MAKTEEALARGKRLCTLRKQLHLTRPQFAHKMNVNEHTLKSLESGARELSVQSAREYVRMFLLAGIDVSFEFLYYGKESEPSRQNGVIDDKANIENEIVFFKESSLSSIILKIQDGLMSPFYNKEDIVGGQKITDEKQFSLLHGHFCIIEATHGVPRLRRIIKSDRRKVICCTLNTDSNNNLPLVEEIEAFSLAQATRHWHLSALVQNLSIGNEKTRQDLPFENGKKPKLLKRKS